MAKVKRSGTSDYSGLFHVHSSERQYQAEAHLPEVSGSVCNVVKTVNVRVSDNNDPLKENWNGLTSAFAIRHQRQCERIVHFLNKRKEAQLSVLL